MSKERDPSGRFAKTPSDGAQAESEPEAEPAEPGNLAQLLAAVGDQIRGLERRQTEARETDNAALRADLNRVERLASIGILAAMPQIQFWELETASPRCSAGVGRQVVATS